MFLSAAVAGRAVMIRIVSPCSVCAATKRRPLVETPKVMTRASPVSCERRWSFSGCALFSVISDGPCPGSAGPGGYPQSHAGLLLERAHDTEEVLRARVAARRQHPMQALARLVQRGGQCFESDGGVDQIAQDGLPRGGVAPEIGVDRLREEHFAKARVALRARHAWGLE